jgi:large subunit ribosomal protein L30
MRVTLLKSPIGYSLQQKRTLRALGLKRQRQSVEHDDNPAIRGMVRKVAHLVSVDTDDATKVPAKE